MKGILFLFVVLFSTVLLAQTPNWTSVKETNINVGSALYFGGVDIFTNRDGNHIIVQENNNLKYYKMNLNGVAGSPITIENSAVLSPSISGDADNIYIVYGIGSQMRVRRSTNGGSSWSLWKYYNLTTDASLMESVVSNGNLHITFLESSVVKYRYYKYQNSTWYGAYTVSAGETGTYPKITARYTGSGNDYIYFMWQKSGTNTNNWRKYEVTNNSWSSVLSGYTVSEPNLISSNLAGIRVEGPNLIAYHSFYENGTYSQRLGWAWLRISDNTLLDYMPNPSINFVPLVYSTTTFDNISHSAYYFEQVASGEGGPQSGEFAIRRSKSLTGYPDDIIYDYNMPPNYNVLNFINISSAGNEVHVIWKDEFGNNNGNNLRYIYDDQTPVAPVDLTLINNSGHPRLQWPANSEPDINYYTIYRNLNSGLGYLAIDTTTDFFYDDPDVTINTPGGPAGYEVYYKITATDITSHQSGFSNTVSCNVPGGNPQKAIGDNQVTTSLVDYKLDQNHPNPFNPTTSIKYQLKEKGFVSLRVYDMIGKEVAVLVNENQDKGTY